MKIQPIPLIVAAVLGTSAAPYVAAAEAAAGEAAGSPGEEVIVTGTRRTDRSVTDSASPVDVISSAELRSQPAANMLDQIKYVVPSFFVGQNTISDASSLVRAPSLRGLPSDEILVMLNGKRFNRSALVQVYTGGDTELAFGSQGSDISSIPSIGVKNLEVLRDGATAQYGSDAIAGVLNYGLRDDTGVEFQARYGQYQDHGDGRSYQAAANGGLRLGSRGFVNLSAEYDNDGQTSRGAQRPVAVVFAQENPGLAGQLPNSPLPVQIWGQSPSHGYKLLLNAALEVTDGGRLYLIGNVAESKTNESFNYRSSLIGSRDFQTEGQGIQQLGGRSFFQHPYYQTQCAAGTCPAGGYVLDNNVFNLSSIYPAGFTPRFVGDTKQDYGTLGYKGNTGGLGYDLSLSTSRNAIDLSMYDSIAPSFGGASQTRFDFGQLIQKEFDANLDLTYGLEAGLASPITLSGGAEFRRESFTATAGDFQSYGAGPYAAPHPLYVNTGGTYSPVPAGTAQTSACPDDPAHGLSSLFACTATEDPAASGYGGTSPTYAGTHSQRSHGIYVGAEADVLKSLSVGVAGRYESYSSFGSKTVGKFNIIWHANDVLALRATVGSGFHAPSPGQNNTQVLTTSFLGGISVQQGTFPVTSAVAQYYGARSLKPERSTNFGAGIVVTPSSQLTATLDLYDIKVRDRIFISQSYTVLASDIKALPELASVGENGTVQYFTNALDTTTKGVDLVGTYALDFHGRLNLSLAYNYNKTTADKYDPNTIARYQVIDIGNLAPHNRATLAANWSHGALTVNVRENYWGSWVDANDYPTAHSPAGDSSAASITAGQVFGAKLTTDFDVSYGFLEHYTLTFGGANIFNTYPDKIAATADNPIYTLTHSLDNGSVYPRNGGPFGINGAFWYLSLRAQFK